MEAGGLQTEEETILAILPPPPAAGQEEWPQNSHPSATYQPPGPANPSQTCCLCTFVPILWRWESTTTIKCVCVFALWGLLGIGGETEGNQGEMMMMTTMTGSLSCIDGAREEIKPLWMCPVCGCRRNGVKAVRYCPLLWRSRNSSSDNIFALGLKQLVTSTQSS